MESAMKENKKAETAWRLLFMTVDSLRRSCEKNIDTVPRPQATFAQIKIMGMIFLKKSPSLMLKEIANGLNITPGAVSQTVDVLVKEGMLKRCVSKTDRRAVSISLTKKGEKLRAELEEFFTRLTERVLDGIPAEKQEVFLEVLDGILTKLNQEIENPAAYKEVMK